MACWRSSGCACGSTDTRAAYRITYDDLWTWMEDMRSWHIWQPERLPDPAMRTHFSELRRDWLTTHQVAALLCLSPAQVNRLRREGRLPAVKPTPRAAWYRRCDVLAFQAVQRTELLSRTGAN